MITDAIAQLVEGIDLGENEARDVMNEIMTGQSTPVQIAAFLTALRMKGETLDELVGFARVMREQAKPLWEGHPPDTLDTAGTGGDQARKPFGQQPLRKRGRYGSVGYRYSDACRKATEGPRRSRNWLLVRTGFPSFDEARHARTI
jgi:hypothetical protein